MRLRPTALLLLLAATPAAAQSNQNAKPPSGQTLFKSLSGDKNRTSPFDSHARGETQEQHDHYARQNPGDQPITSATVKGDDH